MRRLDAELAATFADSTLGHVEREFPHSMRHVWQAGNEIETPRALHPIFFGSYDWHSCVHGWWQLARIARLFPELPQSREIRLRAERIFTVPASQQEVAYFRRPGASGFERPYGWAWLLALHGELARYDAAWAGHLAPLACVVAERFKAYLPRLTHPVRHGVHANTAFAMTLALEWGREHDPELAAVIARRADCWFADEVDVRPLEPSGEDFLSPTLCTALLMSRLYDAEGFEAWFRRFLPSIPSVLTVPAAVTDRSDGRLAHLDGLNLSRAWAWRTLGVAVGDAAFVEIGEDHLEAALPHLFDDYMGEHWLATFALLAFDPSDPA